MYRIGVDLGGTNIAIGVVNEKCEIVLKDKVRTGADREADLIIRDMADLTLSLISRLGITASDVSGIGVATPGIADCDTGCVVRSCNLPFSNYPLAAKLSEFTGIQNVKIANDANAAALGEAMVETDPDCKNSVMITLGTGVGGGIIIDGEIYAGTNFAAAELGHIVIKKGGRLCGCGRRGCWEAYSSATGLTAMTNEKIAECRSLGVPSLMVDWANKGEKVSARTAFNAARKGDAEGEAVVSEYIEYLACGLTNMINIFQPDILYIGGGVCGEGDYLLDRLNALIDREKYGRDMAHTTKLKIATLGNDAGIVGAAALIK